MREGGEKEERKGTEWDEMGRNGTEWDRMRERRRKKREEGRRMRTEGGRRRCENEGEGQVWREMEGEENLFRSYDENAQN